MAYRSTLDPGGEDSIVSRTRAEEEIRRLGNEIQGI